MLKSGESMREMVFREVERPRPRDQTGDLRWFCDSLGIVEGRDVERLAVRILITLLEHYPQQRGLPVDTIASNLDVTNSRVNHHLRNLVDAGIVYRHKRLIYIRGNSLRSMVRELRKDVLRVLDDLEDTAAEIDLAFGIEQ